MYVRRHFPFRRALGWTWDYIAGVTIWSTAVFALYHFAGLRWLSLPPTPLSILGTAVAFYLGFKGNTAYGRLWEARQIWGGIVNSSRTWAIFVRDYVTTHFVQADAEHDALETVHRELVHRHIAWLHALRTILRRRKPWETHMKSAREFRLAHGTENMSDAVLEARLTPYLKPDELRQVMAAANPATRIIANQSARARELHASGLLDDFRHIELGDLLETLYTLQGKCERIKNFPLPRQYASANTWFVSIFVLCVPLALVHLFAQLPGGVAPWLAIPVGTTLGWVFLVWNKIVDWSENPFEGLANDTPIDSLTRTIEIDLLELIDEPAPAPLEPKNDVAM